MPHREVMDGVLVIFGGAFLITPGLHHGHRRGVPAPAADAVGGPRAWWCAAWAGALRWARPPPGAASRDYDVEGTAREYDDSPQRRLER